MNLRMLNHGQAQSGLLKIVCVLTLFSAGCPMVQPRVNLLSFSDRTVTTEQTVMLTADAVGLDVTKVVFYDHGEAMGEATSAPHRFSWNVTRGDNGKHDWTAEAFYRVDGVVMAEPMTSNMLSFEVAIGPAVRAGVPPLQNGLVGFIPGLGTVNDVAVQDDIAYLASREFGMSVVDVSAMNAPRLIGSAATPFVGTQIAVNDAWAIVAGTSEQGTATLSVVDVTQGDFAVLGTLDSGVETTVLDLALASSRSRAVAAVGGQGLWVIEIDATGQPALVGSYDTPGWGYGIDVDESGARAYVADGLSGLQIVSLSNPANPTFVGSKALGAVMRDVVVDGATVYLASQSASLRVLDVSVPSAPRVIGGAPLSGVGRMIVRTGDRVAVLSGQNPKDWLEVFDVSDPAHPAVTDVVALGPVATVGGLVMSDARVYAAAFDEGLTLHDLNRVSSHVATMADTFKARSIARGESVALVGGEDLLTGKAALLALSIDIAGKPTIDASLQTNVVASSGFLDLAMNAQGTRAVAAMGGDGLWVLGVAENGDLSLLGSYDTPGWAYGVELSAAGTRAYVAAGFGGLQILDLTNPSRPSFLGSKSVGANALDVAVDGDVVYLASQSGTMRVLDVSDPSTPRTLGYALLSGIGRKIVQSADRVAVLSGANRNDVLDLFDIADPTDPVMLSATSIAQVATVGAIALTGETLHVTVKHAGLETYATTTGVLEPQSAVRVLGEAHGLAVDPTGSEVLVADSAGVVDVIWP